mgnify:FL=1
MAFKLLLTENQSALSQAIRLGLEDHAYTVVAPPDEFQSQDLLSQSSAAFTAFIQQQKPSLVINTLTHAGANTSAGSVIAAACHKHQIPCLHLSSYRVFGTAYGGGDGFDEAHKPEPDDAEGKQLLAVEQAFLEASHALVLRLPWLVTHDGDNIFTRVAARLGSGEPLAASDICRGCPVTLDEVRRIVVAMVLQILCGAENWGVVHLHTSDSCSEVEFADHIARLLEKEGCKPGPTEISRDEECRLEPGCGLLAGDRCKNNFGIQLRKWRLGMKPLVQKWLEQQVGVKE